MRPVRPGEWLFRHTPAMWRNSFSLVFDADAAVSREWLRRGNGARINEAWSAKGCINFGDFVSLEVCAVEAVLLIEEVFDETVDLNVFRDIV